MYAFQIFNERNHDLFFIFLISEIEDFLNFYGEKSRKLRTFLDRKFKLKSFSETLVATQVKRYDLFLIGTNCTKQKQEDGYWIRILELTVWFSFALTGIAKRRKLHYDDGKKAEKSEIENPFTYQLTLNRCLTLWSICDQCFYFPCLIGW